MLRNLIFVFLLSTSGVVSANTYDIAKTPEELALEQKIKACMQSLRETGMVDANDRVIYRYCETQILSQGIKKGRLAKRIFNERATELNPFVITPHKQSYILPITVSDNFNRDPYDFNDDYQKKLEHFEAKYQMSFKVPLRSSSLFFTGDSLYFAMTIQAWWQLYADEISKPFRETNYTPEIFYVLPLPWRPFDGNMGVSLHLEHQSNGQSQQLSRSWNRLLVSMVYEKDDYAVVFKPWYRFEEKTKIAPLDPQGDDNPDIHDYLGYYELSGAYAFNDEHKLSFTMRKNWRSGNGALEVNYTFPFPGSSRLVGIAQYFTGYGESLIDYNHKQQKFGLGIAVNDIF